LHAPTCLSCAGDPGAAAHLSAVAAPALPASSGWPGALAAPPAKKQQAMQPHLPSVHAAPPAQQQQAMPPHLQ